MGAWGTGNFENDDVLDWKIELLESEGLILMQELFESLNEEDEIEVDVASKTLCAAEVLAALQGKPGKAFLDEDEELYAWIQEYQGQGAHLLEKARKAVVSVKEDSELKELWEESDDYTEWLKVVSELASRLIN